MNSRSNWDDNEITNSIVRYDEKQLTDLKESLGFHSPLHEKSQEAPFMNDDTDCDMDDHNSILADFVEHINMDDLSDEEMDKLIDELLEEYYPDPDIGKRLLLRSDFENDRAYSQAVSGYIQDLLREKDLHPLSTVLDDNRELINYTLKIKGSKVTTYILVKYERCVFEIFTNLMGASRQGRTALIDNYCNEMNNTVPYSTLIYDQDLKLCTIKYSSCFCGAFSEEAFSKYLDANNEQLFRITVEYNEIATGKKLSPDQRRLSRRLIYDLANNLSSHVKPENRELFNLINDYAGVSLNTRQKKLLNYFLDKLDKSQ